MKYRLMGKTGYEVSEIGFGAWALASHWGTQSDKDSLESLHAAIDRGVNFIDTAAAYGGGKGEQMIAKVLKERKERVYVSTKTPPMDGPYPPTPYCDPDDRYSAEYLTENLDERCAMLGTDKVDILLLHSWTRAWNEDPKPLKALRDLQKKGKVGYIGVSTPEHDQNSVVDLIRNGWVDVIEVIYNIFEQEPAAHILPMAKKHNVGIIGRVAFDEGALTGKFSKDTEFEEGDFRSAYFSGDRLSRTVERVEALKTDFADSDHSLAELSLQFILQNEAVSTVIPGMRKLWQVEANTSVSDMPPLDGTTLEKLRSHIWRKVFWYFG
jgi:aryl-alcohol dehydrogenase-like predicted oxidoreductase